MMWSFHVIHLLIHSNTHSLIYFFCSVVVKVQDHLENCQIPRLGDLRHVYDHLEYAASDTLQFWGYDRATFNYSDRDHGPPTIPIVRPRPPAGPAPDDDDAVPSQASLDYTSTRRAFFRVITTAPSRATAAPEQATAAFNATTKGIT